MARANLKVHDALVAVLNDAAEGGSARAVGIEVGEDVTAGKTHVIPLSAGEGDSSQPDLWSTLAGEASAAHAAQTAEPAAGGGNALARLQPLLWAVRLPSSPRWVLVSFVPDGTHPRQKILYASARDDVRRALGGPAAFKPDYHVTELPELSADAYAAWASRDSRDAMTLREIEQAEVLAAVEAHRATLQPRVQTIAAVPFTTDEGLAATLAAFAPPVASEDVEGGALPPSGAPRWLEIAVRPAAVPEPAPSPRAKGAPAAQEVLALTNSGPASEHAELTDLVCASGPDPRFFLLKPSPPGTGRVLLLMHVPEGSKPKVRMTYATAKAAVVEAAGAACLPIARTVETRDRDDVATALADFCSAPLAPSPSLTSPSPGRSEVGGESGGQLGGAGGPGSPQPSMPPISSTPARYGGFALPGMGLPLPGSPAGGGSTGVGLTPSALRSAGFKLPAQGGATALSPASSAGGRPVHGGLALPGMGAAGPGLLSPHKAVDATTSAHSAQPLPMPAAAAEAAVEAPAVDATEGAAEGEGPAT